MFHGTLLVVQLFAMKDFERHESSEATEDDVLEQIKSHQTVATAIKSGQLAR